MIPIPKRMAHLDRDKRGYPIPVMVWRDSSGLPHFTINDEAKRFMLLMDDQCSICGRKLLRLRWFVGGPLSAFHERGTYMDPPLHRECMTYAMQACPWLAAPTYARPVGTATIRDPDPHRVFIDPTHIPNRPIVFVCVGASSQTIHGRATGPTYITPKRPYTVLQFWRGGKRISEKEAFLLLKTEVHQ